MIIGGTHETVDGRALADWFGTIVGKPQFGPYSALGWKSDDQIRSAILFTEYNGSNIDLHMVGQLRRPVLRSALRYAFQGVKVLRITAKPSRSNISAREMLLKIGFEKEAEMTRYYGPSSDDDAIVYRLDRHNAEKWMS